MLFSILSGIVSFVPTWLAVKEAEKHVQEPSARQLLTEPYILALLGVGSAYAANGSNVKNAIVSVLIVYLVTSYDSAWTAATNLVTDLSGNVEAGQVDETDDL